MKLLPPLRTGLAVVAVALVAVSCSSNDKSTSAPNIGAPSSTGGGSPSSTTPSTPSYDRLLDFVVGDQGLVSMPLPQDAIASAGERVDLDLTNQSHSGYRLQLFDRAHTLVQQMDADAGTEINMIVKIPHPGLYTVQFLPTGGGQPSRAPLRVTDKPH